MTCFAVVLVVVAGCSSTDPGTASPGVDAGVDALASLDGGLEAETGQDAGHETGKDAAVDTVADSPQADALTEAPDSPLDAPGEADAPSQADGPEEAAAPSVCAPPGPAGNVADCSSLCTSYCEPACSGAGLPGGVGTCDPYLTCDAANPISLSAPIERAFVLPAETGVHQGTNGTNILCAATCGQNTSFAFRLALGHCVKLTSSGGRAFIEDKADCSKASECAIVQGSQYGTVVRVLAPSSAPAAWVFAQVDESWSGHPCPYSCP